MKILSLAILWISVALLPANVPQPPQIVTAAQVNGTWQSKTGTFKILAIGKQRLRVEWEGAYFYKLPDGSGMANTGEGRGIAIIEGIEARFKPEDAEDECEIRMKFIKGKLEVTQEGICGFGLNVSAAGTYRRVSSRKPKFGLEER